MRRRNGLALAAAAIVMVPSITLAQATMANEESMKVAGGGITVPGWVGKVDAKEAQSGMTVNHAKLAKMGNDMHVTTGPAITYWNPNNKAAGDYTVKATFNEAKFMEINPHAHPYGIVIAGNDLGTPNESYLYCSAYGDGRFIVRGFGPAAFQMGGRAATAHPAVAKAAGKGSPVKQEIAISVKGDKVDCIINGQSVASYSKADLVQAGKLKSTDGVYGIRFGHNTDAMVTGLTMTKH